MDLSRPSASLYVHIPFCTQRCSYCDFYFVTTNHDHEKFVDALCLEITQISQSFPDTRLSTIYFGGGTPSRLSPQAIAQILTQIHRSFNTHSVNEITLEANPEDLTATKVNELKHAGVTRISLGVQSFKDDELRFMNRCHNSEQASHACNLIHAAGFTSWSLDLIFGIPGTSIYDWEDNLQRAVETSVPHISTYSLTVEPRTPLHKQVQMGAVKPTPDEQVSRQFQIAIDTLQSIGYKHYEVSSFARPKHRSEHNMQYWQHTNYLGIGPGAHSFWWEDDRARRWENIRNLHAYTEMVTKERPPMVRSEILSDHDLAREKIMLALRTSEGLDLEHLWKRYGLDLVRHKQKELQKMITHGLITRDGTCIRLTTKGMHICDGLATELWPD